MLSDPVFGEAAEPERLQRFIGELEDDGFERVGPREWKGPIRRSLVEGGHTDAETMTVIIRPSWPYLPPLIEVPGIVAWHADQERLCIWQAEDNSQRWATLQGLYDRIDEWVRHAEDGFAIVENARNPEIYWQENTGVVFALVDLEELLGRDRSDGQHGEFHFSEAVSADGRLSPSVFDLRPGVFSAMTPRPAGVDDPRLIRGRWFYRASVAHPPRGLEEFIAFLTSRQRERLEKDLRDRPFLMFGLLWQNKAGLVGTMLLTIKTNDGGSNQALVVLRPKGKEALLLRAGPDAKVLQERRVTILGVGAIGSHVAEQLARAGIGKLQLVDSDVLWPANPIRHAAPPGTPAGMAKTVAMQEHLAQYPWIDIDIPHQQREGYVWTLDRLAELLASSDLTIDATGHVGLAEVAARVAQRVKRPFASVALFRGGAVVRVRRQARRDDVPLLERPHLDGYPEIPPLDEEAEYVGTETGCLAQVHNAPPVSVAHAASLAAEVAIDHLTGRYDQPDEIIEVIRPGDPPFDRLGRLRPEDLPLTVDVSERAQRSLREAARAAMPNETGGILLGCIIDRRPVIAEVVEIRDGDATAGSYRIAEGKTREVVARARDRDSRLGYVGEWHSHPSLVGPSPLDVATMLEAAQDSGNANPVLLLAPPGEPRTDDLQAYVTIPWGLKPADLSTTGDLPPVERADTA